MVEENSFDTCSNLVINYDGNFQKWKNIGGNNDLNIKYSTYIIYIYIKLDYSIGFTGNEFNYNYNDLVTDLNITFNLDGYTYDGLYDNEGNKVVDQDGVDLAQYIENGYSFKAKKDKVMYFYIYAEPSFMNYVSFIGKDLVCRVEKWSVRDGEYHYQSTYQIDNKSSGFDEYAVQIYMDQLYVFSVSFSTTCEVTVEIPLLEVESNKTVTPTKVIYGSNYKLMVPINPSGLNFIGYFTEPNGQGLKLTDELGNSLNIWNIPNDTKIYAYFD